MREAIMCWLWTRKIRALRAVDVAVMIALICAGALASVEFYQWLSVP